MVETDSNIPLTRCQGVSAVERKTEAGNSPFSLKMVQKREMRKSTTQGDIMEWTGFVQVFRKCCHKCCGLTNCPKQNLRGLLEQIKSSIVFSVLTIKWTYSWKAINIKSIRRNGLIESSVLSECKVFWFWGKYLRNVWNNSEHVWIVSLKHLIIDAVFPSFPVNVLTHEFELRGVPISRALLTSTNPHVSLQRA